MACQYSRWSAVELVFNNPPRHTLGPWTGKPLKRAPSSGHITILLKTNNIFGSFHSLPRAKGKIRKLLLYKRQWFTNPKDETLPSAEEAQFVASSLPFLPVCGQESPTHLSEETSGQGSHLQHKTTSERPTFYEPCTSTVQRSKNKNTSTRI